MATTKKKKRHSVVTFKPCELHQGMLFLPSFEELIPRDHKNLMGETPIIVWFGTRKAYDNIDAKAVKYDKTIRTEAQYEYALEPIYELIQLDPEPGTGAGDELEILSLLVKEYENAHYPVPKPHPIEAIKFRLEQLGLPESELNRILGSRSRKSEILSGNEN